MSRTLISGAINGVVTEISGGKFANGFSTGVYQSLFNDAATNWAQGMDGRAGAARANALEKRMQEMMEKGNAGIGHELSYREAKWRWKNANGAKLVVDGRMLSTIHSGDGEFVAPFPLDDLKVNGHVRTNPTNGRIYDGMYDFEPRVMPNPNNALRITIRNYLNESAIKEHGPGKPFMIEYRYKDSDFD